jgi:tetratricopeptide (TPR) repeat protein
MSHQGNTTAARTVLEEASKAIGSADDSLVVYNSVLVDILDRKYEEALNRLSTTRWEAFVEQFYFVPKAQLSAQIYGLMGEKQRERQNYESALRFLENKIKTRPDDPPLYSALGIAYAGLGFKDKAIQAARKAVELMPVSMEAYRGIFRVRDLAQVYVMVGEYDKAFDRIEYLLSIPGELSVALLKIDPVWAPLRGLPRFHKLVEKY